MQESIKLKNQSSNLIGLILLIPTILGFVVFAFKSESKRDKLMDDCYKERMAVIYKISKNVGKGSPRYYYEFFENRERYIGSFIPRGEDTILFYFHMNPKTFLKGQKVKVKYSCSHPSINEFIGNKFE